MSLVKSLQETLDADKLRKEAEVSAFAQLKSEVDKDRNAAVVKKLATHIHTSWNRLKQENKAQRKETIEVLRRSKGEYSQDKLSAIKAFKGSEQFIRSGENKCRAASSWITDIYRGENDLPWSLEPTAIPSLPNETKEQIEQEIMQEGMALQQQMMLQAQQTGAPIDTARIAQQMNELKEIAEKKAVERITKDAKAACDAAALEIRDDNQEGGWNEAFKNFVWYFVRCKAGIIKGPVLKKVNKDVWQPDGNGGFVLGVEEKIAHDVYCTSPFNWYPSRSMTGIADGDCIEVHELSRKALTDLIGVPGYKEDEIRIVLANLHSGNLKPRWLVIDDELEVNKIEKEKNTSTTSPTTSLALATSGGTHEKIQALEFYGSVSGQMLIDWGLDAAGIMPEGEYQANCWKIGDHVIKAVINPDSLGRKPYHVSSWAKNPQWVLGEGLLEFAAPIEDILNSISRAISNNIAIASGPQVEINTDRCDDKSPIYPWKKWLSTSAQLKEGPAVQFWQPNMHCQELIQAYEFFRKLLDEMTVPAYAQGAAQSGVTAGTATVFTELLAAAARSIKAVVGNIDDDVITPYIQMCYDAKMRHSNNPNIKGDAKVVAKGVSGLLAKEQQAQRKTELLQVVANPVFSQVLGSKNIGALIAQIFKASNIVLPDLERLEGNPTLEELITKMNMQGAGVDPMQATGQIGAGGTPTGAQELTPDGRPAGAPDFQQPAQIGQ